MTSFTSLMSSLGGQSTSSSKPSVPATSTPILTKFEAKKPISSSVRPADVSMNSSVTGHKRKLDDTPASTTPKTAKLHTATSQSPAARTVQYKGTARPSSSHAQRSSIPATNRSNASASHATVVQSTANAAAKPLRGFAATLAKAQAAASAVQASGPIIKHKPVEKLSKKDRDRLRQEQHELQKSRRGAKVQGSRSRNAPPSGPANGVKKRTAQLDYKGTMKKATETVSYKGTMRIGGPQTSRNAPSKSGSSGGQRYQDDDDDDDEDDEDDDGEGYGEEDEGSVGYDSAGSSDMEGGFDDMEREESHALRLAQQEDRRALMEEERHKQEKLERKRKLLALSRDAAAKRRY